MVLIGLLTTDMGSHLIQTRWTSAKIIKTPEEVMEDARKNETEKKEDWEAPLLTVLDVDTGTEGNANVGGDFLGYS